MDRPHTDPATIPSREGTLFTPYVTVIMPIHNEASFIKRSLGAVLTQEYPLDQLEVLIADGMSTDETRDIINQLLYVGGRMVAVSEGWFESVVALATNSPFAVGGARFHFSEREDWVDTVYLGAWPREVFERFGLFDEEQVRNQDDEFNYRLLPRGGKILLSSRIKSSYYNRIIPRTLWRQYYQYGYWKVRVMQKAPRQMRLRHFVPPLFMAVLPFSLLMAPFSVIA